jgi:hypothetical protein
MRREWLLGLGALLTIAGVVFTLQGLGYVGGSAMSGDTFWAVVGPILAVAGLLTMALSRRRRRPAG